MRCDNDGCARHTKSLCFTGACRYARQVSRTATRINRSRPWSLGSSKTAPIETLHEHPERQDRPKRGRLFAGAKYENISNKKKKDHHHTNNSSDSSRSSSNNSNSTSGVLGRRSWSVPQLLADLGCSCSSAPRLLPGIPIGTV